MNAVMASIAGGPTGRSRARVFVVAVGALVLAALGLFFAFFGPRSPTAAAAAFAQAWEEHDWTQMDDMTGADGRLTPVFEETHDRLGVSGSQVDAVRASPGTASFRVSHTIGEVGSWSYETRAQLRRTLLRWSVVWDPSLLHPSVRPGLQLDRRAEWPKRAPITGHEDAPLTIDGTVVSVGLEPRRIQVRADTLAALEKTLRLDPPDIERELDRPGVQPHWFVPLVELREERYSELRPRLEPIPGVVFRREPGRVTPTEDYARHVIGDIGEITAERLKELGPPYRVGDTVGLSGLERVFERRLAGSPAVEVVVVDGDGRTVETLHTLGGKSPAPVRTTIDRDVQSAAEAALDGLERPAALVAVDASNGEIRAVASRPTGEPFNRALAGRYPPGSTFKIVTSAALLGSGMTADTSVACPREVVVGRPFRNFEGRALGQISFRTAFVESCNTAFVGLSSRLAAGALERTAESFGFGAQYDLPLPVAGGRFPPTTGQADAAAAAIGQGRVVASPLHMATVAGAIASGAWRPPTLLVAEQEDDARPLDRSVVSTLREWMRGVVSEGTGRAAAVAGQEIGGKTGTAEFGAGDPPPAHAWFVGFRESLAFAVVVEGGGPGGVVAAPIAARFLESVRGR